MIRIVIALVAAICLSTPALSSPLEQSCKMRAAIDSGGQTKPTDVAKELFAWNKSMSPATIAGALAILDTTSFVDADVFEVVSVGDYFATHVVAGARKGDDPIFTLLRYERITDTLRLTNVRFKDSLLEMLPTLTPGTRLEPIACN